MRQLLQKACFISLITILGSITFLQVCIAEKISDYPLMMQWEYTMFIGNITDISPHKDYIVASGRKIYFVDTKQSGNIYRTRFRDPNGDEIGFEKIESGKWIFAWGGVLRDNSIGAKDIVLLPGKIKLKERNQFPALKDLQKWGGKKKHYM